MSTAIIGSIAIKFKKDEQFYIYSTIKALYDDIKSRRKNKQDSFNYKYDDIHTFHCIECHFRKLPKLPKRLVELDCSQNDMVKLPKIPKTVTTLKVASSINLKKLKNLPSNLKVLDFSDSSVEKVVLPMKLIELHAENNNLPSFRDISPKLRYGLKVCYLGGNKFRKPYKDSLPASVHDTDCEKRPTIVKKNYLRATPSYTSTYSSSSSSSRPSAYSSSSSRPSAYSSSRSRNHRYQSRQNYIYGDSSGYGIGGYGLASAYIYDDYGINYGSAYVDDYPGISYSSGCDYGGSSYDSGGCDYGGGSYDCGGDGGCD